MEPVSTNYRGYDVWELPPNGQGIAALQILNILEGYDIASWDLEAVNTYIISWKLKNWPLRTGQNTMPIRLSIRSLLRVDFERVCCEAKEHYQSSTGLHDTLDAGKIEHGNTIYMTVADKDGNMISLIQSNYRGLGSGMCPPGLGFILQDRGELFTLEEGHYNVYEPGKRPFHTIIPAFITKDGKPWMSFGVMGGSMQPQGHAQIVVNMIDFGMNLQEAGDAPRIRHGGSSQPTGEKMTDGGIVYLESGIPYESIRELVRLGHRIQYYSRRIMVDIRPLCGMKKMGSILGHQNREKMGRQRGISG